MNVAFFLPENFYPTVEEELAWEAGDYWQKFPRWATLMQRCWIYQSWFFLKKAGLDVTITKELPEKGVVITCSNFIAERWHQFRARADQLFIINVLGDREPFLFAHLHVVQNRFQAQLLKNAYYMPHWPQPHIIPRRPERGDRFETIAYFGGLGGLEDFLIQSESSQWLEQELGMQLIIPHAREWHDFREIDLAVGIRSFSQNRYLHKPSSKLYNAWLGEVPFIGGNDSAFVSDGHPGQDYLIATTQKELLHQIKRLKDDPSLRHALVERGKKSILPFRHEVTLGRWRNLIEKIIPKKVAAWEKKSYRSKERFWKKRLYYIQRDYRKRPDYYSINSNVVPWLIIHQNMESIELLEKKISEAKQKSDLFLAQGNHEVANRYHDLAEILHQFLQLRAGYGVYYELLQPPIISLSLSQIEAQKLFQEYQSSAAVDKKAGREQDAQRLLHWAQAIQEVSGYYDEAAKLFLQELFRHYRVPYDMILAQKEKFQAASEKANLEKKKEQYPFLKAAWSDITKLEQLYKQLKLEKLSTTINLFNSYSYSSMMALFWYYWRVSHYHQIFLFQEKAYTILIPLLRVGFLAAKQAAHWHERALSALDHGAYGRAACYQRAAFWAANRVKVSSIKMNLTINRQLAVGMAEKIDQALQANWFILLLYCYFFLPLITILELFFSQERTMNMIQPLITLMEKKPFVMNAHLEAIIDRNTVSEELAEKLNKPFQN